jgi:hypothetical protein
MSDGDDVTIAEAAAIIETDADFLESLGRLHRLPGVWNLTTGQIVSIPRSDLPIWAAAAGRELVGEV